MANVRDLLERKGRVVFSIAPQQPVLDAIRAMSDKHVGALVVMEDDRLVGIVSERDYARKVILAGRSSKDTPVESIMTPHVVCCSLDTSVEEGMAIMTERRIRHLPVLDGQRIAGVVSIGDLVKAIISEQRFVIEQLERYVAG
jgi:CBS domain-containing protein